MDPVVTTPPEGEGAASAQAADAASAQAAAPAAGEAVGTTVPVERFNGLMSANDKLRADLAAEQAARVAAEARIPVEQQAPVFPVTPALSPEVRAELDELRNGVRYATGKVRETEIAAILTRYPHARYEDVRGEDPATWEASAKAVNDRIATEVEVRSKEAREAARQELAEEFGIPVGGGSSAPVDTDPVTIALKAARESGDMFAATKAILGGG